MVLSVFSVVQPVLKYRLHVSVCALGVVLVARQSLPLFCWDLLLCNLKVYQLIIDLISKNIKMRKLNILQTQ